MEKQLTQVGSGMKKIKILFIFTLLLFTFSAPAVAGDFNWVNDFNIQARTNPMGFRASLAARFDLSRAQALAVIRSCDSPADAYIILRLSEISRKPGDSVTNEYRRYKDKGWGYMASSLGIKPGSEDFHNLKLDHDLHRGNKHPGILNVSSDKALLLVLARNLCMAEAQNKTVW